MTWKTLELGEVLTLQRGFDISKKEQKEGEYPVVSSSGIQSYHNEFKVKGDGVVIGRKGTLGTCFYIQGDFWAHSTGLYVKDFKGNHRRFTYYLLKTLNLERFDVGASNPSLNRNHAHKIIVRIPTNYETQEKIASILSAYDDLIENNLNRIRLLEEAAQHLYREWFVKFRFPGWEAVRVVDGLPEGWEKVNLYDFASLQMGFPFKAEDFNEDKIGTPVVRIRDIPNHWTNTYSKSETSEDYFVEKNDIVVGMDGFFYTDVWGGQKSYLVQRVCRIRPKDERLNGFLLEAIKEPIKYFERTITGATVSHLGAKHLKQIEIIKPDEKFVPELEIFNSFHRQRVILLNHNQRLKEARDLLLPRLMNQTIEI